MSLEKGSILPEFELTDQNGEVFRSSEHLGKQPLVVFFYPKNFTPGCTKEACSFRDAFEDFSDLGAKVIGISADSEASHQKFASRYRLPFTLLSDKKNQVRKLFGVKNTMLGMLPGRETFIFDSERCLVLHIKALGADPHITKALKYLSKKH